MELKKRLPEYKKPINIGLSPKDSSRHSDDINTRGYRKYKESSNHAQWQAKGITKNKNWKFEISIETDLVIAISFRFQKLFQKIDSSLYILRLKDDWDDQGSKGYSKETFHSAGVFIVKYFNWVWEEFRVIPEPPNILPGPDGSIDLLWQNDKYDLLINCKEYPSHLASFYGDDKKITKIEGQFDISKPNLGLFLCLLANK
ncbi:MAG: hypothetical protein M3040_05545 [Bacteroidota bacterium]|nr:hypothetical protein [Bacteroidota bacterium]